MKKLLILALVLPACAMADESVRGYIRSDGTYVAPHHRSSANNNPYDNYSTQGNRNPYTGQQGTVDPYRQQQQSNQQNPYQNQYNTNRGQNSTYGR